MRHNFESRNQSPMCSFRCRLGWQGPKCKQCAVLPGCAHGTCQGPLECRCDPGWTGLLCQTRKFHSSFPLLPTSERGARPKNKRKRDDQHTARPPRPPYFPSTRGLKRRILPKHTHTHTHSSQAHFDNVYKNKKKYATYETRPQTTLFEITCMFADHSFPLVLPEIDLASQPLEKILDRVN